MQPVELEPGLKTGAAADEKRSPRSRAGFIFAVGSVGEQSAVLLRQPVASFG
jgi:hypothetical protein